jgi:DNA-binding NtrC family response regulator
VRRILVMEEHALGEGLQIFLKKAGYQVILVTSEEKALKVLNGEERIDFVISAGLRWKRCYELSLFKFGYVNTIILTGDIDVKKELEERMIVVFEKPAIFPDLLRYVVSVCPPN